MNARISPEAETGPAQNVGVGTADARAGAVVEITNATKRFETPEGGNLTVLENVSYRTASGEFLAIVGPSGCGKTTLLRAMQGLEELSAGSVLVDGAQPREQITGMVFQRASLLPWQTVEKNMSFALQLRAVRGPRREGGLSRAEIRDRVDDLLRLTGLETFRHYYPRQLSGGMQQRVNLARALAVQPRLLLMDEPFSALDAQTREALQLELQGIIQAIRTSAVFVTHDIREAAFLADRVLVLSARPGHIVEVIDIEEPRPRTAEYQHSSRLGNTTRYIWELLRASSGGA